MVLLQTLFCVTHFTPEVAGPLDGVAIGVSSGSIDLSAVVISTDPRVLFNTEQASPSGVERPWGDDQDLPASPCRMRGLPWPGIRTTGSHLVTD
jgi:hypothetical protein